MSDSIAPSPAKAGRPLLFVDIDGVLNPYGRECPRGYTEHHLFPDDDAPVRVSRHHGEWLHELARYVDLMWASAWSEADRALLQGVLLLPPFHGAAILPRGLFDPGLKVPAIEEAAGGRPLAWIDDLIAPAAWTWAHARPSPTLLVPVDPETGLTRQHVDVLLDWATSLRPEFT